jgi:hypothetical protein
MSVDYKCDAQFLVRVGIERNSFGGIPVILQFSYPSPAMPAIRVPIQR